MLQSQIPVTVSNVPIAHAAGKERSPFIYKMMNVPGEALIRGGIKGAANVRFHLCEVLLPVTAYDLQPAKACNVFSGWDRCVELRDKAGDLSEERRGCCFRSHQGFQDRFVGKPHHHHGVVHDLSPLEGRSRQRYLRGREGRAEAKLTTSVR